MWDDLGELIESEFAAEIGAGGSDGLESGTLMGATATLTATGADHPCEYVACVVFAGCVVAAAFGLWLARHVGWMDGAR